MKKRQKRNELSKIITDNGLNPVQKLILLSLVCDHNPKKFKKALIKFFGKRNIKIHGGMSLDEFVNEWCQRHFLMEQHEKIHYKLIDWLDGLLDLLDELPDMYRGTKWEHLLTKTAEKRTRAEQESIMSSLLTGMELVKNISLKRINS